MGLLTSFLGGGGPSAKSQAQGGDQSANIENGLNSSFVVGDGNKVGDPASGIAAYLPLALIAGAVLVGIVVLKR